MSDDKTPKKQKRVVIVGNSPLPMENAKKTYAPGIRTWHFGYSAKEANCKVMIIGCRIQKSYDAELPDVKFEKINDMYYYSVEPLIFENKNWLKEKIINFKPDCIIGVNTYPSSIVAQLDLDYPFWTDLNGSAMAEAQAKASVYDDNSYLEHFFKQESKILGKADTPSFLLRLIGVEKVIPPSLLFENKVSALFSYFSVHTRKIFSF